MPPERSVLTDETAGTESTPSQTETTIQTGLIAEQILSGTEGDIRILRPGGRLVLVGSDALCPSMLSAPLHRMSLSVSTFLAVIGKGGLQRTVDMVSAADFRPAIEEREGFEGVKSALEDLGKRHPSDKTVINLAD